MKLGDDGKAGVIIGLPLLGMLFLVGILVLLMRTSGNW